MSMKPDGESKDSHWVETLFPPHFSWLSLVEEKQSTDGSEESGASTACTPSSPHFQSGTRRQDIYKATLHRFQQREEQNRKKELVKRITRNDPKERGKLNNESLGDGQPEPGQKQVVEGGLKEGESSRCIWTDRDIDALRRVVHETEGDRSRLRSQLGDALVELRGQEERRRQMQNLVEEREQELGKVRQEATHRATLVKALQAEGRIMAAKLQTQAEQVKDATEGKRKLGERLKKVTEEMQEVRGENSNLAWDLKRLKNQLESEVETRGKALQLEHNVALQRLQRELETTKTALKEERERHIFSRTALDLLRRHFNNQSHGRSQTKPLDKITHI